MNTLTPFRLRQYARLLQAGGVIAYPTEAVFGLGCDARNVFAVDRILRIKRRPMHKGLILIGSDWQQLSPWLQPLPKTQFDRIQASWQQSSAITWLLPARSDTPYCLRGDHDTLAVRITKHPVAAALCHHAGFALVSTSTNRSGCAPCRTALAARTQLGHELDAIVVGDVGSARKPSEIRTLDGHIVRAS